MADRTPRLSVSELPLTEIAVRTERSVDAVVGLIHRALRWHPEELRGATGDR
jgi:hypothetical protein